MCDSINFVIFLFLLQKFKSNAEPPNLVEPRDTDAEFNKLRENDSSIVDEEDGNGVVAADVDAADVSIVVGDGEMTSPTVAAATKTAASSPRRKSLKKKAVRSSLPMKFKLAQKVIIKQNLVYMSKIVT